MKQKFYIPIFIAILLIIIVGTFIYLNYQQIDTQQIDSRCNWNHGFCENICLNQNYYFDKESGQCYKYIEHSEFKGCCTPPPFGTLDECKSVCE